MTEDQERSSEARVGSFLDEQCSFILDSVREELIAYEQWRSAAEDRDGNAETELVPQDKDVPAQARYEQAIPTLEGSREARWYDADGDPLRAHIYGDGSVIVGTGRLRTWVHLSPAESDELVEFLNQRNDPIGGDYDADPL